MDPDLFRGGWDRSTLPSNVRIGARSVIERRGSLEGFRSQRNPGLEIGADVRVHTWSEFNVEAGGSVRIGDGTILVGAVFMCAERITVGRDVLISFRVTIMDSDFHALDVADRRADAIANAPDAAERSRPPFESLPVVIEDRVRIGIGALILKGVTIGAGARIEAGSVVTRDVPADDVWAGNPARSVDRR